MRALIQRVSGGAVSVNGEEVGRIGRGIVVLVGVGRDDTSETARRLAERTANLRIFPGPGGEFDRSLLDEQLAALVISQFTLYADTRRGRRPSFIDAAPAEAAAPLVDAFADRLRQLGIAVAAGRFGAHMLVEIWNDGPVTVLLEEPTRPPSPDRPS
ncbi:MAG: D-tyrosyl-tRNA(Tyr) deacylase [Chloroflexi bacterium]|nr:D-tyrosyl-tRNA(Tyr) deacylase [Chloroflexota bacterium]